MCHRRKHSVLPRRGIKSACFGQIRVDFGPVAHGENPHPLGTVLHSCEIINSRRSLGVRDPWTNPRLFFAFGSWRVCNFSKFSLSGHTVEWCWTISISELWTFDVVNLQIFAWRCTVIMSSTKTIKRSDSWMTDQNESPGSLRRILIGSGTFAQSSSAFCLRDSVFGTTELSRSTHLPVTYLSSCNNTHTHIHTHTPHTPHECTYMHLDP